MRIPAIITGSASGICTLKRISGFVSPIPFADSINSGEIPCMPVNVFFTIGNREYSTTTMTDGRTPIPRNGMAKPSSAILGTA